jgi:hypothetical protein
MDLKLQLQSLQKGHLTMQAYLDKKRTLAYRLRQIGSPVSDADLQLFILHGLNIDYDSLVVSLTSRSDVVSVMYVSLILGVCGGWQGGDSPLRAVSEVEIILAQRKLFLRSQIILKFFYR